MKYKNKTVIVTGTSGGIGSKMTEMFAARGYNTLINYFRSEEKVKVIEDKLRVQGYAVKSFKADVADRYEVDRMIDYCVSEFGGVDVLINNAGISQFKLFIDINENDWNSMMNVNLKGVFNCTQSVLRYMLPEKFGSIINISSIWGLVGASCEVHYSASKAAVIGFTKALAKELGPSNIRVNGIAPGVIDTEMIASLNDEDRRKLIDQTPLMRIGKPEDIAAMALYLASDNADFITGQILSPNGGFVI